MLQGDNKYPWNEIGLKVSSQVKNSDIPGT